MSQRPGFTIAAEKKNGKLTLLNERRYRELSKRLPDGDYDILIEKHRKAGSAKQRGYYFGVVVEAFADHWGVEADDAHELLKQHCNKKIVEVVNKETGVVEEVTIGASTAGFTSEQWTLYIERCQRWGATDWGFVVPAPDPEHMFNKSDAA